MKTNSTFLKFGCKTAISRNGTLPVEFSIEGLGRIESNGRIATFHAPNVLTTGKTVIKSIDGDGIEESITIRYGSHLHVIADILQKELNLSPGEIVLEWEDFKPEKNGKTMFYIGTQSTGVVGNNSFYNGQNNQYVSLTDSVSLQVMGIKQDTQRKAVLAVMALKGQYAKSQCETNNMKIASIPQSLSNVSLAEGPGPVKRFAGAFNVFYNEFITKEVQVYENFQTIFIQEQ